MVYLCCSVGIGCFSRRPDQDGGFHDKYGLVKDLGQIRDWLAFSYVDLGPYEVFSDYLLLREVVRSLQKNGLTPRLITSGEYFTETAITASWFRELTSLGVSQIVLRLDRTSGESLPESNLFNFVNASCLCGLGAELRFELEDTVPEVFFHLSRRIEELRFYTQIYPVAKRFCRRIQVRSGSQFTQYGGKPMRVVVTEDGEVLLRHRGKEITEFELGLLGDRSLRWLLDPARLGLPEKPALKEVACSPSMPSS